MNKAELINEIAENSDLSKSAVEGVVNAVFDKIVAELEKGEEVKLSGFGIFSVKARAARVGTNPANQSKIEIPASKTVNFKVSKTLKEKLN